MSGEREPPNDPSSPSKEKDKGGEGRSQAWWPMECSQAWWPMECSKAWWSMACSKLGGQWNVPSLVANGMGRKNTFSPFPTFRPTTYFNLQFFDLEILLYHGPRSLFTSFLHFFRSINYNYTFRCN